MHGRKGLTLIELIVSLSIIGIILAPISLIFYSGYGNFYYENDDMINIEKSREVMDNMVTDLRMNESPSITVSDEGNTLFIKEDLVYTYSQDGKMLLKNGIPVLPEGEKASMSSFKVEEVKPSDYDSKLINITFTLKVGRSREITLQNSFRRKADIVDKQLYD